jgi:hypothetical protein
MDKLLPSTIRVVYNNVTKLALEYVHFWAQTECATGNIPEVSNWQQLNLKICVSGTTMPASALFNV